MKKDSSEDINKRFQDFKKRTEDWKKRNPPKSTKTYHCTDCDIEFEAKIQSKSITYAAPGECVKWVECDVCSKQICLKSKGPRMSLRMR